MLAHKTALTNVTYCGIDGRLNPKYITLIIAYAEFAARYIDFAKIVILTPKQNHRQHELIQFINIDPISSLTEYSNFCLQHLNDYIDTPFCIIYQWDGCISNPDLWNPRFFEYDYIGAPWPAKQYRTADCLVGNGGFSWRSKKFLTECTKWPYDGKTNEDITFGVINRKRFIQRGIVFADGDIGKQFSIEQKIDDDHRFETSFGFHTGNAGMKENLLKFMQKLRSLQLL